MATYIQIGANIGNDHFQSIIANLHTDNNNIHLIEPNSDLLDELKANYANIQNQNIKTHNIAITPTEQRQRVKLYLHGHPGHASLISRKSYSAGDHVIECDSLTLDQFFKENNIKEVELLLVDCEGLDVEILKNTNLKLVDIKCITFEVWPYENDDANEKYNTGPSLTDTFVQTLTSQDYVREDVLIDGQPSIQLTKITKQ